MMEQARTEKELSAAASNGDIQSVSSILERTGIDVNFPDPLFHPRLYRPVPPPPLYAACQARQLGVVKALLNRKDVQVNVTFYDRTPLYAAAEKGYVEIMKLLFDHGASPGSLTDSNPLICAVKNGQYEATALLLQKGADPNDPLFEYTSRPPLVIAASNGHSNLVKLLLDKGADIEPKLTSHSALTVACSRGHTECARLLIERGANLNVISSMGTPLTCALANHQIECAKLLLEKGADVNQPKLMNETPLMVASKEGHVDEVKLLLKYNANVTAETTGFTALYLACCNDHIEVAKVLIENGADVNQIADKALEILLVVIERKYSDIACLLIRNGARVNTANISGETPLVCAVRNNDMRVVEELVQHGANVAAEALSHAVRARNSTVTSFLLQKAEKDTVHKRNGDLVKATVDGDGNYAEILLPYVSNINLLLESGDTALMEAAKRGQEEHVKLLLDHGAQVNIQNADGYTALMIASQRGLTKCTEQLVTQKDIDVNLQNSKECTALMLASEKGHTSVVDLLLANNADLEILTTRRCSALFYGVKSNSPAVVKVLLDKGANVKQKTLAGKNITQFAYECHKEPDHHVIEMLQEAQAKVSQAQDDKPTLKEAFQLLFPLAHEWHNIGVLLGIPDGDLDAINADNAAVRSCLREMLRKWLSRVDSRPTWSSLAEAVEPFDPRKVEEIHQKYCSNKVSLAIETHEPNVDQDSVEDQKEEAERNDTKGNTDSLEDSEDERNTENTEDPSDEERFAAVEKAITEKGTLEHTLSHGVMVGPARSGKSSLMSRLAGEMPSSTSPSTGVAEKIVQVVGVRKSHTVALSVHDTIWFKLLYDQEAIRLMKLAIQNIPSNDQPQKPAVPLTDNTVSSPPTPIQSEPENISPIVHTHEALSTTVESVITPLTKGYTASYPEGYVAPMEVFKGAIQGKDLEFLRQHFEKSWSFYLTDTGGQVEFQELLPLLVSGPSVFFFTFRLDQELNQRFTIEYHLPDGGRSKPYQSTLTVVEAILQTLASVASMGTFTYKRPQAKSAASLKPKMFIVGTHKDKLDTATADSKIKKIDQFLQQAIKSTSHYQGKIVQFASESQLIFTVNNFSEDDSDFKKIRSGVERVVCRSQFKIHFPTHWLIFSLVLRQETIKDSIISYEQCLSIAKDCGIADHEELNHALWFLHTKIGLIRHFPTAGLRDFVVRDPQILFDMVTKLIVNTFTFENADIQCSTEFEKKGVFTLEDFLTLQHESPPLLPPEKLLQLLEHLQIVAPFQEEDQKKFFIPCVLAHSDGIERQSSPQSSDIPPLLITFKCGYCPKGLSGALIIHLLTNKMWSKFKWELKTDQLFRNQVSFLVSYCDIITLKIHPTFLELIHSSAKKGTGNAKSTKQSICNKVRCSLESSIRDVSSKMNLTSNAEHSLSFYCRNTDCIEQSHPATEIVEDEDGTYFLLCKNSGGRETSDLPQGSSVWFESEKLDEDNVSNEVICLLITH